MTNGNLAHSVDPPQAPYFGPQRRAFTRSEPSTEIQLRETLDREETVRRQMDELIRRHQEVLLKLFGWQEDAAKRVASLTPRQREIMELVLAGQPSKNIAADLGVSQRTVENHRASIMKKTASKSLPALARLALAAAWTGAPEQQVQPNNLSADGDALGSAAARSRSQRQIADRAASFWTSRGRSDLLHE